MNRNEEIRKASQFVSVLAEDLGINVEVKDAKLGRLKFPKIEKDNGFVCFFATLEVEGKPQVAYLKAFKGSTPRTAKLLPQSEVTVFQNFSATTLFPAALDHTDNRDWCYTEKDGDCVIISKDEYKKLKKN